MLLNTKSLIERFTKILQSAINCQLKQLSIQKYQYATDISPRLKGHHDVDNRLVLIIKWPEVPVWVCHQIWMANRGVVPCSSKLKTTPVKWFLGRQNYQHGRYAILKKVMMAYVTLQGWHLLFTFQREITHLSSFDTSKPCLCSHA